MKFLNYYDLIFLSTLSVLVGCNSKEVRKEALIGKWECIRLNNHTPKEQGFEYVTLEFFSNDSMQVTTHFKKMGDFTTKSKGPFTIENNTLKSKLGEEFRISNVSLSDSVLRLSPDPLFNEEMIQSAEYKKVP